MEEKYLITIKGTMEQDGKSDTVELMTRGSLVHKDGAILYIRRPKPPAMRAAPPP